MSGNLRSTISILLIVAALAGSAFIWYKFFTSKPVSPVTKVGAGAIEVGPKALLTLLESLEGLKLDLGILEDPVYKSLQDYTPEISAPETKGRQNSLAPF